ncbi:MAG TPA: hypothetical protein VEH31_15835 [Streptosporangiaceae bacterium]|nr:hypothetical protein [Streptosporangiaceae bacterium]
MSHVVTVPELLDGHTVLDIECLDRIYLNGYVPALQVGGQVITFLHGHLGMRVASPAVLEQIGSRFRQAVARFAEMNDIPMVKFKKGVRKIDVMRPLLERAERAGRSRVVAIGWAQEFQHVWDARKRDTDPARPPQFSFAMAERRVTCYYFYVWDVAFGPAFIKVCAYFPYPVKVWVNGHEWAKRQAATAGLGFTELSNGFASCQDPAALQALCDRLGPGTITVLFERWMSRIPLPLTAADRAAGYWWELSMRQVEVSRTLVFAAPRHARAFFEALVADNLDLGRPEHVELLFKRSPRGRKPKDPAGGVFKTAIDRSNQGVTINAFWRHSRVKQYLKDGRALRIETVVDSPDDLGCQRRLHNLPELQARARAINTRLLETEKVGQGCVFDSPAFARISQPTLTGDGRRAPGLRFGDPRVMALAGALANTLCAVTGITSKSLRALMAGLLGTAYTTNQASYDLARLARNGLITRIPHRNLYTLTGDGLRFAIFYTKVHDRVLRPLLAGDQPQAPPPLRDALRTIDHEVSRRLTAARLPAAA